jgi:hypothetical protein
MEAGDGEERRLTLSSSRTSPARKPAGRKVARRTPSAQPSRDHLRVEVPDEMLERLAPEGEGGMPLLRLTLRGTTAGFPFLSELYQRYGLKCRILKVWFEYDDRGAQYGQLLTELADASGLSRARSFFGRLGIGVEVLGYMSPLS